MLKKNPYENEDLSWQMHMQMLMMRKRNMEIAQIIDDSLYEYYSEKGLPVPNWKTKKDPQWWIEYLEELGLDSKNP
ncbi:hypothetical protein N9991_00645 [bacterium]|nr:hypothetical protein [bacterium]MDB4337236.1 hypothetical protein [bacterium]|tara:strand:- start:143 stop:370 length:228 start_codon:yes stop_codon:yes gene_type:complete